MNPSPESTRKQTLLVGNGNAPSPSGYVSTEPLQETELQARTFPVTD